MGAIATREPALSNPPSKGPPAPRLFESGGVTLEDVVLGLWEDLCADGRTPCPVCGGSMDRVGGCDSCGAELS